MAGGSMAGLLCAIALRRHGCTVDVFERAARPLEGRGAGIVLHPAIGRAVAEDVEAISVRATALRYIGFDGRVAHQQPCSLRFTSFAALHAALLRRFDGHYRLAHEVTGFASYEDRVDVLLFDGGRVEADALVCADGSGSASRMRLLPGTVPRYVGYVGWRGTVSEAQLDIPVRAVLSEGISYCVVPDGHLLVYPIPRVDGFDASAGRLVNWVWYRNVAAGEALDAVLTDKAGVRRSGSLTAGTVPGEAVSGLREFARLALPEPLAEMVGRTAQPFVQAIFELAAPRMACGRIALIGDAAFVLRPHIAVGTAKAAEDAYTLARRLAEEPRDFASAMERWETEQMALGTSALERSARAGERVQVESSWTVGEPLPFGLYREGDSEMR